MEIKRLNTGFFWFLRKKKQQIVQRSALEAAPEEGCILCWELLPLRQNLFKWETLNIPQQGSAARLLPSLTMLRSSFQDSTPWITLFRFQLFHFTNSNPKLVTILITCQDVNLDELENHSKWSPFRNMVGFFPQQIPLCYQVGCLRILDRLAGVVKET